MKKFKLFILISILFIGVIKAQDGCNCNDEKDMKESMVFLFVVIALVLIVGAACLVKRLNRHPLQWLKGGSVDGPTDNDAATGFVERVKLLGFQKINVIWIVFEDCHFRCNIGLEAGSLRSVVKIDYVGMKENKTDNQVFQIQLEKKTFQSAIEIAEKLTQQGFEVTVNYVDLKIAKQKCDAYEASALTRLK